MAMSKKKPDPMRPTEIVKLFAEGLTIDMLSKRVASHDQVGGRKAKTIVSEVIYLHQLKECGKLKDKEN